MEKATYRTRCIIACVFLFLAVGCAGADLNAEKMEIQEEAVPKSDEAPKGDVVGEEAEKEGTEKEETETEETGQDVPEAGVEEEKNHLEYYLEMANDDVSSVPVYLEVYGEVNLVTLTVNPRHPVAWLLIADDEGNILLAYDALSGFPFWDVFVEDLDQDGRQDIWVVYGHVNPNYTDFSVVFYQTETGFYGAEGLFAAWGSKEGMEEYYGDYRITRFCPAEGYDEIGESVLMRQEAEQMLGKEIRIRGGEEEELFITYDSERRRGMREGRKPPTEESMVTKYDYSSGFVWHSASPETLIHESYPDERMREAVGEEYYEKINGSFYNEFNVQWQHFYTMEGEDKLIMYSRMTGQYFILEKENSGNGISVD